jgi:CHAT domain-containing protein
MLGIPVQPGKGKFVAVAYSDVKSWSTCESPLLFHEEEVRVIEEVTRGRVKILSGRAATLQVVKEAIAEAEYIHFSCHAQVDHENPLASGLMLAPQEPGGLASKLTLGEVFESVHVPRARLVVMSACETGLTKPDRFHDEYVSLTGGFLYAGARTVISTLWRIPDLTAWFLMRSMYSVLRDGSTIRAALSRAQNELRALSLTQARDLVAEAASQQEDPRMRTAMLEEGARLCGEYPFASPYWWAGFTVNGLG